MKQQKIVKVTWLDACDRDMSNEALKELIDSDNGAEYLVETETIGELIKNNDNVVVVRSEKANAILDSDEGNELTIIPKDWIIKIEYYKK